METFLLNYAHLRAFFFRGDIFVDDWGGDVDFGRTVRWIYIVI